MVVPVVIASAATAMMMRKIRRNATSTSGSSATGFAVLGRLARRLGLEVKQGDPNLDLLCASPEERRGVGLVGTPYGRKAALSPFTWTGGVGLFSSPGEALSLWVMTGAPLPDFEVTVRKPGPYMKPVLLQSQDDGCFEVSTGDPRLDQEFRIVASDRRIGPMLRPAIAIFAGKPFVHLFHSTKAPGMVACIAEKMGLPYVLQDAEDVLYALEIVASQAEGRTLPPRLNAAPVGPGMPGGPPVNGPGRGFDANRTSSLRR